jgi:hypothetical protein
MVSMVRWFRRKRGGASAAKRQGDLHALDRPGDPRGGVQSDEYRHASPEDLVEEDAAAARRTPPRSAGATAAG